MFILAGVLSQLYLGMRFRLSPKTLGIVLCVYLIPALVILAEVIQNPPTPVHYFLDDVSAVLTFWGWLTAFAAIVVFIRTKLPQQFSEDRRKFLNVSAAALCAAPALALGAGIIIRKDFQVKEFDLAIPNLPKDLQGLRLLQLSDIHMSAFYSRLDLRRVVDASNNLRADLAFVTGDLITDESDPLDDCLLELKRLRTVSGIWGCMGNHEKIEAVARHAARKGREMGIRFLRRENQQLRFGDSQLNLVGVDHQFKGQGYLTGIDKFVEPDQFNLLLSHNPDVFPVAAKQGFDLILAGHTHGGQINLEIAHRNINIVDLVTPYTKGLYQQDKSSLYVTSGLGTIGVPVRLGAPPEITLIQLCKA